MNSYKCASCKTVKQEGDKAYLVLDTDGIYKVCCSMICANEIKSQVVKKVKKILEQVENQYIEEEVW